MSAFTEASGGACVVMASDTEPVREVVAHEQTGLLVPPQDIDAWERQACAVLDDPASFRPLGEADRHGGIANRLSSDSLEGIYS